jgi:hypothetical protein
MLLSTGDIVVLTTSVTFIAWMSVLAIKVHQLQTSMEYGEDGELR